jgi:hypothetical protein
MREAITEENHSGQGTSQVRSCTSRWGDTGGGLGYMDVVEHCRNCPESSECAITLSHSCTACIPDRGSGKQTHGCLPGLPVEVPSGIVLIFPITLEMVFLVTLLVLPLKFCKNLMYKPHPC